MNFNQLSARLREESARVKNDVQEVMQMPLLAYTTKVFTDHTPDAHHMKLSIHFRPLDSRVLTTPLECFFPEYMKGVKFEDVKLLDVEDNPFPTMLKVNTKTQSVWIHIQTSFAGINCRAVNAISNGTPRLAIETRTECVHQEVGQPVFLILVLIEPYTCTLCGACRNGMRKCKGCWDGLGISVRYCSKHCQRAHYNLQHKHVCGKHESA